MKWFLDIFKTCGKKYGEKADINGWIEIRDHAQDNEVVEIGSREKGNRPVIAPAYTEIKPAPIAPSVRQLVANFEHNNNHPNGCSSPKPTLKLPADQPPSYHIPSPPTAATGSPKQPDPVSLLEVELELRRYQASKRRARLDQRVQIDWARRREQRSRQATFPPPNYHLTKPYRSLQ